MRLASDGVRFYQLAALLRTISYWPKEIGIAAVVEFYRRLGYSIEERVSMAKPLEAFASAC